MTATTMPASTVPDPGRRPGAVLLPFRPIARRPRRTDAPDGAALGAILLFTGVRYERSAEAEDAPAPQRRWS